MPEVTACGTNAHCVVEHHQAKCKCDDSHNGNPNIGEECLPYECEYHRDCNNTMFCHGKNEFGKSCVDPCNHRTCGKNAICIVDNHEPVCKCPDELFEGNPNKECFSKLCNISTDCFPYHECDNENKCSNPCNDMKCGQNEVCKTNNHQAECECISNFHKLNLQSERGCIKYECNQKKDCQHGKSCNFETFKCEDPCEKFLADYCKNNSECVIENGNPTCRCPDILEGNPWDKGCHEIECSKNKPCPRSFMLCSNGTCTGICN